MTDDELNRAIAEAIEPDPVQGMYEVNGEQWPTGLSSKCLWVPDIIEKEEGVIDHFTHKPRAFHLDSSACFDLMRVAFTEKEIRTQCGIDEEGPMAFSWLAEDSSNTEILQGPILETLVRDAIAKVLELA